MEDLAVITALNHLGSFGKNFVKFKLKKIEMLFISLGRSYVGKICALCLEYRPRPMASVGRCSRPQAQFFPIRISQLANNIYS